MLPSEGIRSGIPTAARRAHSAERGGNQRLVDPTAPVLGLLREGHVMAEEAAGPFRVEAIGDVGGLAVGLPGRG
jgi:hypothetical protein